MIARYEKVARYQMLDGIARALYIEKQSVIEQGYERSSTQHEDAFEESKEALEMP